MLKTIYIKCLIIEHSITEITHLKSINQYTTDVVDNYKINKVSNLKKAYYMFIDGVVIDRHKTIYTHDSTIVTKINKLVNFNDNHCLAKKIEHTNKTTNNITRHNRNNDEHNVIKKG